MMLNRRAFLGTLSTAAAATLLPRLAWADESGDRKKGVALVGLGRYATSELGPALRETKHCRLAGVVTGDPEKGRHWARDYGFPETSVYGYDTMQRIAENPDIDVIYVVTPNALHRRHVEAAAKTGKQVICEKPMATSVADCDAMIAACKNAGVHLAIGYRLHFEPHTMEFIRLSQAQEFGPFLKIKGVNGFRVEDANGNNFWRLNKQMAGGGPLMDMGVYVIQAVCMAKAEAPPVAITAQFGPNTRPEMFDQVEETIHWEMEYADSAKAKCSSSYANNDTYFHATAPQGWVDLGGSPFFYLGQELHTSRGDRNFPPVNQQALQMDGMIAEWAAGKESRASGEMGRRDVTILEAIYRSANNGGQRVTL
ncbi:MAG TPA: Gfo/Idh/MocA family oxidoreductase [Opitutaceae bacterium]|jgi:glucose-fructose oxidoreductase